MSLENKPNNCICRSSVQCNAVIFQGFNCFFQVTFKCSLAYCSEQSKLDRHGVQVINTTKRNKSFRPCLAPPVRSPCTRRIFFFPIRSSFSWCAWPGLGENFISVVTLAGENDGKWQTNLCCCGLKFSLPDLSSFSLPNKALREKLCFGYDWIYVHVCG